jgi:hypothetical protein
MPDRYGEMIRAVAGETATSGATDGCGVPFRALGWRCHIGAVAAMMNIGSVNSVMI